MAYPLYLYWHVVTRSPLFTAFRPGFAIARKIYFLPFSIGYFFFTHSLKASPMIEILR